jgi:hypothetical protein
MNLIELNHSLRQLRLGGMAAVLETHLHQAQVEAMARPPLLLTFLVPGLMNSSNTSCCSAQSHYLFF